MNYQPKELWFWDRYLMLVVSILIWATGVYGIAYHKLLFFDSALNPNARFYANATIMFSGLFLILRTFLKKQSLNPIEKLAIGFILACAIGVVISLVI